MVVILAPIQTFTTWLLSWPRYKRLPRGCYLGQEVDVKQRELEERGVTVEQSLRHEGPDAGRSETDLMQEWFNLVHEKNALVRLESELMVRYVRFLLS